MFTYSPSDKCFFFFFFFQKALVRRSIEKTVVEDIEKGTRRWQLFKFTRHRAFYITVYCLIVLDMVNVGFSIASEFVSDFFADKNIFRWINVVFVVIYIIEAILKVSYLIFQKMSPNNNYV